MRLFSYIKNAGKFIEVRKLYFLDAGILILTSLFFLYSSWQKWIEPMQDFGRELYVPWQLMQGQVLYKDLAFLFGAFTPYWNAFLFYVFGSSILTLVFFNLFVVFLEVTIIYRIFLLSTNRFTAFMASIFFVVMFVFARNTMDRLNMHYITPYTHSNFYALFFALLALHLMLSSWFRFERLRIFILGLILGLMCLSRFEIFLSFILVFLVGMLLLWWKQRTEFKSVAINSGIFILGFLLPLSIAAAYFSQHMPLLKGLLHEIGYNSKWQEISKIRLYRIHSGEIFKTRNLQIMTVISLWYVLLYFSLRWFCHGITLLRLRKEYFQAWAHIIIFLIFYLSALYWICLGNFNNIFRCQHIILGAFLFYSIKKFFHEKDFRKLYVQISIIVGIGWGLTMLLKMPLNQILSSRGAVYCLPGALFCVGYLIFVLPKEMEKKFACGRWAAFLVASFLLITCVIAGVQSLAWFEIRKKSISDGFNQMKSFDWLASGVTTEDISRFLEWTRHHVTPLDTYIVLPEGVMLNYLTGHKISGKHITFMPAEVVTFGERAMLKSLKRNPPNYVVLANKDMKVYGKMNPGVNYLKKIYKWVHKNYGEVWYSQTSEQNKHFGIRVFKKHTLP